MVEDIISATAVSYMLAYMALADRDKNCRDYYGDTTSIYIFPATVIAALACEIGLKRQVGMKNDEYQRGHDLEELFLKMDTSKQHYFEDRTIDFYSQITVWGKERMTKGQFRDRLHNVKDTFCRNRYLYEKAVEFDADFLEAFMFSLNATEEEYKSFKERIWKSDYGNN